MNRELVMASALLLVCAGHFAGHAQAQDTNHRELIRIVSHSLISKSRVGRTEFEYEYAVIAENNTSKDYSGVTTKIATVNSAELKVIDGQANIGLLRAFTRKKAADTVKVRVNRIAAFNPSTLLYSFDNNTVDGIDANGNGVRDDIEDFILSLYPRHDTRFKMATDIARAQQNYTALNLSDAEIISNYENAVIAAMCLTEKGEDFASFDINFQLLHANTTDRRSAHREFEEKLATLGSFEAMSPTDISAECEKRY
jgi:hypothetical protein